MFHKETRADIQPGAGEDVRVVVDGPVGPFQLPAQGLRRVGQLRCAEGTVDQARFFPGQRGGGRAEDLLEQLERRSVNIARFGSRDNARFRRHDLTQRAQLLLQQRHGFWHFDQHHARRLRVVRGAVEELHAGFFDVVMAQVFTRRQLAQVGIADTVRRVLRQGAAQRAKGVIQDQNRAADFSLIQLLQQIFIRRFPRLKRVNVIRFRETFKVE